MSNSLLNTGISGLNTARTLLEVTGNNVRNAYTKGYNRQQVKLKQINGSCDGNGVTVSAIARQFDRFTVNQLRQAIAEGGTNTTYHKQLSRIDKLFADRDDDISHRMKNLFGSLDTLSANASDNLHRQDVLRNLQALTNEFNWTANELNKEFVRIDGELVNQVGQINRYTAQIADLNEKITHVTAASGGQPPHALLDERDKLVTELNEIVSVVVSQDNGNYTISMNKGLSLVKGSTKTSLELEPSAGDNGSLSIIYPHPSGEKQELGMDSFTNGSVNGLLKYRAGPLTNTENQLGLLALNLANKFNNVHGEGVDIKGVKGQSLFRYDEPLALVHRDNQGTAQITAIAYESITDMQAKDYLLRSKEAGMWEVVSLPDHQRVTSEFKDGKLLFDGLSVAVEGSPKNGDQLTIKPLANIAGSLASLIDDPNQLATGLAGGKGGVSDNRNLKKMIAIRDEKLIGKTSTLSQAYGQLVSFIGSETRSAKLLATTNKKEIEQLNEHNQSISGVNVEEEYLMMQANMQYYQANAQTIQTAREAFDTILGIFK